MKRTREFEGRDDFGWLTGKEGRPAQPEEREQEDWDFAKDEPRPDLDHGLYIGDDVRTRRIHDHAVDPRAREFASVDRDLHDRSDYNPERFGGPDDDAAKGDERRYQDRDERGRFIGDDEGVGGFEK
jgi:hypothetical protein